MWFGSLQAEGEAEARFLTSWASAFANFSPDKKKKKKRYVHPCLSPRFKNSEQSSVLSASRCLPSGVGSALWNLSGGRYFALQTWFVYLRMGWSSGTPCVLSISKLACFQWLPRCTTWSLTPGLLPVVADFLVLSLQAWGCSRTREEVYGSAPLSQITNFPYALGRERPGASHCSLGFRFGARQWEKKIAPNSFLWI